MRSMLSMCARALAGSPARICCLGHAVAGYRVAVEVADQQAQRGDL
jgi:hypothetical protein